MIWQLRRTHKTCSLKSPLQGAILHLLSLPSDCVEYMFVLRVNWHITVLIIKHPSSLVEHLLQFRGPVMCECAACLITISWLMPGQNGSFHFLIAVTRTLSGIRTRTKVSWTVSCRTETVPWVIPWGYKGASRHKGFESKQRLTADGPKTLAANCCVRRDGTRWRSSSDTGQRAHTRTQCSRGGANYKRERDKTNSRERRPGPTVHCKEELMEQNSRTTVLKHLSLKHTVYTSSPQRTHTLMQRNRLITCTSDHQLGLKATDLWPAMKWRWTHILLSLLCIYQCAWIQNIFLI